MKTIIDLSSENNVLDTVKLFLILFHLEKTLLSKWERDTTKIVFKKQRENF